MTERSGWYETRAEEAAARYESVAAERINEWLLDLLPKPPALVLDVGSGSGRDAAWLGSLGYEVIAVEPSAAMRAAAKRWHPDVRARILSDRLPELAETFRAGLAFDFILVNAVWMHVAPSDRERAFRKLVTLLKPSGIIAFTLRFGPVEAGRGMHTVSAAEVESLARRHGAYVERKHHGSDFLGRSEVRWTQLAVRLPDDGAGALPLIRHVILNDDKSSTYKLALLRVLCRIADGAAGLADDDSDEQTVLPLGLVALYWIRLFKPLLARGLPQSPENRGLGRLGFVRSGGFPRLMDVADLDLRLGMRFAKGRQGDIHRALRDARNTIVEMPVAHLTHHDGTPIFPARPERLRQPPADLRLDAPYLWSFGRFFVPRHLWRAFQRHNVWIEPAIVAEWKRLMNQYAWRQGRKLEESVILQGMAWSEPGRAVRVPRERAVHLLHDGPLYCVWSGRRLTRDSLDIDHCFPWGSWPCSDLWNLLPASRKVNQQEKGDRLPADLVLRRAKDRIVEWWRAGYLSADDRLLGEQFTLEASATLPTLRSSANDLEDVFSAVSLQRLRLRNDQRIPEWNGIVSADRSLRPVPDRS